MLLSALDVSSPVAQIHAGSMIVDQPNGRSFKPDRCKVLERGFACCQIAPGHEVKIGQVLVDETFYAGKPALFRQRLDLLKGWQR